MQRAWRSLAHLAETNPQAIPVLVARTRVYVSFPGSSQSLQGKSLKKC
jgi:hypothetical protein